jgi:hypothetical protein
MQRWTVGAVEFYRDGFELKALTHSRISSDFSIPDSANATALANSWSSIVKVVRMMALLHSMGIKNNIIFHQ